MFVDASALMAILREEPDGPDLSDHLEQAPVRMTSAISVLETVISLARQSSIGVAAAGDIVGDYLETASIEVRPVDLATGKLAIDAHARYGKGSGHPARLNLGDCFAYAMARQHRVALLYKGDDFGLTDLA